jgi:hypothetical protein
MFLRSRIIRSKNKKVVWTASTGLISPLVCVFLNTNLDLERHTFSWSMVIDGTVDICRIADYHCLNFLSLELSNINYRDIDPVSLKC